MNTSMGFRNVTHCIFDMDGLLLGKTFPTLVDNTLSDFIILLNNFYVELKFYFGLHYNFFILISQ